MDESGKRTSLLSLASLREEYSLGALDESVCETNPIAQFEKWFKQAQAVDLKEPNAMTLATANASGRPSARVVLLKQVSENGFVFYTNYESQKAKDLETNPSCALCFYWAELERQVRIEGRAAKISRQESEVYFRQRPKGSRLGALASIQSSVIPSRQVLEERLAFLTDEYAGTDEVPAPEYWGGYLVVPDAIEFWQGRPNRLHDRIRYRKKSETEWLIERLSP